MLARVVSFVQGLPKVPLAFMGFGMHRAWFELAFTMLACPAVRPSWSTTGSTSP